MGESDGWIYLGEYSVQASRYRVTIPPCVFDQYEILSRGDLAGWSYEPDINALKLWELGPESTGGFIAINRISSSGDDSPAAFITLPQGVRNEKPEQETSGEVSETMRFPEDLTFSHGQTIHFVTEQGVVDGDQNAIFLLALPSLEKSIEAGKYWIDDPKSLARLMDSSASHLLDAKEAADDSRATQGRNENSGGEPQDQEKSLAERLQISQNSVPDQFEIQTEDVEIRDISPDIFEAVNLAYLLVRYGRREDLRTTPSENHELVANLNKDVEVESSYSEDEQKIVASVPFCIHNRHSVQFKFFVEVEDTDAIETVLRAFVQSSSCESASVSDSLNPRVYMVHERFETTQTDSGFTNNIIYPK